VITTLYFKNGRFGFIRKHTELERLIGEVRELAHDYRLQSVEVRIATDGEQSGAPPVAERANANAGDATRRARQKPQQARSERALQGQSGAPPVAERAAEIREDER